MEAILINCETKQAEIVELNENNLLKDLYKHIKCKYITSGSVQHPKFGLRSGQNIMYVDDEGLLSDGVKQAFRFKGCVGPVGGGFAGNAIIVGTNGGGEEIDTTLTVADIEDLEFGLVIENV